MTRTDGTTEPAVSSRESDRPMYAEVETVIPPVRWGIRQLLRFVAASATGAFVFVFTWSVFRTTDTGWGFKAGNIPILPTEPMAMIIPVYLMALVVGLLAATRFAVTYAGYSRHWATVIAAGAVVAYTLYFNASMFDARGVLVFAVLFGIPTLVHVAVSAWVLDATREVRL